jgi:hypothetical protein
LKKGSGGASYSAKKRFKREKLLDTGDFDFDKRQGI